MKNQLISIIMPCYNAAATLEQSVNSIIGQLWTNWELLILEDGSADNTKEVASRLAVSDSRIKVINSPLNRGVVRIRNIGIRLAKGDWIAFCDADDWWVPQKLEWQMALAEQKKANLLYSAVYYYKETSSVHQKEIQLLPDVCYSDMLKTNAIPMSTAIYRVNSLGKHYFNPVSKKLIHEDYAYWLQLFKKGKVQSAYVKKPTTFIRLLPNSRSGNLFRAAKSHVLILRNECGLPYHRIAYNFVFYVFTAVKKRLFV